MVFRPYLPDLIQRPGCLAKTGSHQTLITEQLSVMTGHQPQSTQGTVQALERIAGVKNFEGVLKGVAATAVDRCVNLNVPPGEHQEGGAELIHGGDQHPLDVKNWQCRQIQDALRHPGKTLMEMVRQVDRTDRENWIAGQPHQQHPFLIWGQRSCCRAFWTLTSAMTNGAQPSFTFAL